MIDDDSKVPQLPMRLNSRQTEILNLLQERDSGKNLFSTWYSGALYTIANTDNLDRFAQAAQSFREIMEKLPRVVQGSDEQADSPRFKEKRMCLHKRFQKDKMRYNNSWEGEKIDTDLNKTIEKFGDYLESNQLPSRKEQSQKAMEHFDPMADQLSPNTRKNRRNEFHELWEIFEIVVHHKYYPTAEKFDKYIERFEKIILDILSLRTAQDQKEIQSILNQPSRTKEDTEHLFSLIENKGANNVLFFTQASDSSWIDDLDKRGYFLNPPNVKKLSQERVNFPYWGPIEYLTRISDQTPQATVDMTLKIARTDNPLILYQIAEIALKVHPIEQSLRLKSLVFQYMDSSYSHLQFNVIPKLIERWSGASNDATKAALKLTKKTVAFHPDPAAEEKAIRREKNPDDWTTGLRPLPGCDSWNYQQILEKNIRPLAECAPFQVACILIDAVTTMITLEQHTVNPTDDEDASEYWCRRLTHNDSRNPEPRKILVNTMTFACQQVFEKSLESIAKLDTKLRNQKWKIFKRLRQHLYALHPTEQTKPWIRELILSHLDYAEWGYHYEFQKMLSLACKNFGEKLLTKEERTRIFDAIMSGPSKTRHRDWMGDQFTEDDFQKYQKRFHRKQLWPFSAVLFGEYSARFHKLEVELGEPLSDEDYSPVSKIESVTAFHRSPKTPEELASLSDEQLLTYINEWQGQHDPERDWMEEVNIHALSGAFQQVFRETIIPDEKRLGFWLKNRDRIQRPAYVRAMVDAMREEVKAQKFAQVDQWLDFCQWVLTHEDKSFTASRYGDESRENPNWTTSRRSVGEFVKTCLDEDIDLLTSVRRKLANLLKKLCTQPDWTLDQEEQTIVSDLVNTAINTTRGRAWESLIDFGFWIRKHKPRSKAPEVTTILKSRFSQGDKLPLTLPEYAILGLHYCDFVLLNQTWAQAHKAIFFPQDNLRAWKAAFSAVIKYNHPSELGFNHLKENYIFALAHLTELMPDPQKQEDRGNEIVDRLGQHLFIYYLWGLYPLIGEDRLLELFYEKTQATPEYWGNLFAHVGHSLRKADEHMEEDLVTRAIEFFEWRFTAQEPEELQEFFHWISAECLPAEWRLGALSKILDCREMKIRALFLTMPTLVKMLEHHPEKVVECFAKLTDFLSDKDHIYIDIDNTKIILEAGISSNDKKTHRHAKRTQDKLLNRGYKIL